MEVLTLCWIFDKRWLFGLPNPLLQFLLLLPIIFNLATLSGILFERNSEHLETGQPIIALIALFVILTLLSLMIMLKTYFSAEQQLEEVTDNYEAIREFTHHFQAKKSIWGLPGLLTLGFVVAQMVINHYYIVTNQEVYPCLYNRIRFWIDVTCLGYIVLVILIFLVCKLIFLCVSWKHPQFYLEYKDVI